MLSDRGGAGRGTGGVRIRDLDPRGRGVGRADGKMTFVHGALPGEEVVCRRVKRRRGHDEAVVQEVVEPSPDRVEPRCRFYERYGGCSLQHLSYDAQLRHKERTLLAVLSTAGEVSPGGSCRRWPARPGGIVARPGSAHGTCRGGTGRW